jgi:ABC-type Fe3+ transport system substrate-binding protein
MPNPAWEGVANQIADSLRKAGGNSLYQAVYQDKVKNGKTILTEIHHRQTPMRIMSGQIDAGVTWASEVRFQESIGNPIKGIAIPADLNTTAIYAGGVVMDAPHPDSAAQWLAFLKSDQAQSTITNSDFAPFRQPRNEVSQPMHIAKVKSSAGIAWCLQAALFCLLLPAVLGRASRQAPMRIPKSRLRTLTIKPPWSIKAS